MKKSYEKIDDFIDNDDNVSLKRNRNILSILVPQIEVLDLMDNGIADNTKLFTVPEGHFFVMGDNRDNHKIVDLIILLDSYHLKT